MSVWTGKINEMDGVGDASGIRVTDMSMSTQTCTSLCGSWTGNEVGSRRKDGFDQWRCRKESS
jgi:hypothetical protein